MGFLKTVFCLGCLIVMSSIEGRAAPVFTVSGGGSFTDVDNDFLWMTPRFGPGGTSVSIWKGGTLSLSEAGTISLEYIGKEANYADNLFTWGSFSGGTTIFSTGPSSPNPVGQTSASPFPPVAINSSTFPGVVSAGALPFSFYVNQTGSNRANGSLDIGYWPLPVGAGSAGETKRFGPVVYALLDDGKTDNDYDDMIVRLTVSEVPEPTTLMLAATAIPPAAGWLLRRRRRDNDKKLQGGSPRDCVSTSAAAIRRAASRVGAT